jgi:hypothetical protein
VADVASDRVYVFSGTNDTIVQPAIVASAVEYYRQIGVPDANIRFVSDIPAGHGFVTDAAGEACAASREPFIVDCDYDQARSLLTHLLLRLEEPSPAPGGSFVTFDQTPFAGDSGQSGMAQEGVVYIPDACRKGGCRVHVAYHGCAQNRESVGDVFVRETGFQRYADTNALVILYPQTAATSGNPQACWDWWGFTGPDFLTRKAPQIQAVAAMLDRLTQKVK